MVTPGQAQCDAGVEIDNDQRSDFDVVKIAGDNSKSSRSQISEFGSPVGEDNAGGGSKVSVPMDSQKLDAGDLEANLKISPRQLAIRKKKRLTRGKLDGIVISQKKVSHIKIYQFNIMDKSNFGEISKSGISTMHSRKSLGLRSSGLARNLHQKNADQAFNLGQLEGVNKNEYIPKTSSFQDHPLGIRP
jgi:hypothetical protein